MKNILITGGSGFLGKNLSHYLNKKKKYNIFLCSRNIDNLRTASKQTNSNFYPLDINSTDSIHDAFNKIKPHIVIHLAATKYVDLAERFPEECIQTNVFGSINIMRSCKIFKISKLLVISTDKAANPDANIYSKSKSLMEDALIASQSRNFKVSCLRFGNLCWSTGSVFNLWEEMSKNTGLVLSTGPEMRRYFIHVDQACEFINFVLENFNKCNGLILTEDMKSAKVRDILDVWCDLYKVKWKKINSRKGDKLDEYLISPNEMNKSFKMKIKKNEFIALNKNSKSKKPLIKKYNSKNAKKLNKKEIKDLILNKPNFL